MNIYEYNKTNIPHDISLHWDYQLGTIAQISNLYIIFASFDYRLNRIFFFTIRINTTEIIIERVIWDWNFLNDLEEK